LETDEFRCEIGELIVLALREAPFDGDVLPLDVSELTQAPPKCLESNRGPAGREARLQHT